MQKVAFTGGKRKTDLNTSRDNHDTCICYRYPYLLYSTKTFVFVIPTFHTRQKQICVSLVCYMTGKPTATAHINESRGKIIQGGLSSTKY